jgi:hypothetical protein
MTNRTDRNQLDTLQALMVKNLMDKLKDGSATAADLNVARQLLKDNNVAILPMESASDVQELASQLPFQNLDQLQAERESLN